MRRQTETTRAARYGRYSPDEKGDAEYTTTDAQQDITARYVAAQGWQDAGWFVDESRTGTNLRRDGWRQLLSAARAGEFDAVVVTFMSRLGRGEMFTIARHELEKAGVRVVTVRESFAPGVAGYAHRQMQQMMDGMYPVMVAEWTRTKLAEMFRLGYHCAGKAPFGYAAVPVMDAPRSPKRLEPDPQTAPLVTAWFDIAAQRGILPVIEAVRAAGYDWGSDRIGFMMRNRVYTGRATWGELVNEKAHPPLVSPEAFEAAQKMIAQEREQRRGRSVRRKVTTDGDYLFIGRCWCACGSRMSSYWARGGKGTIYRYYRCTRWGRGCTNAQIPADVLHETVIGEMRALGQHPWRVRRYLESAAAILGDTQEIERAEKAARARVSALAAQSARLTETISSCPPAALDAVLLRLAGVEDERKEASAEATRLHGELLRSRISLPSAADLSSWLQGFDALWAEADEEERSTIARGFVRRVAVQGSRVEMTLSLGGVREERRSSVEALPVGSSKISRVEGQAEAGTLYSANLTGEALVIPAMMGPDAVRAAAYRGAARVGQNLR